jgi:hypothetical protein
VPTLTATVVKMASDKTVNELLGLKREVGVEAWLEVMVGIVDFVMDLHKQKLALCAPIERCFLVNLQEKLVVCFYFQAL